MLINKHQHGDTIIEVLLAVTVFSMVAVGAIIVMNQGTSTAQRALEINLVKQQIDAQAEALRAAQLAYAANSDPSATTNWNAIKTETGSPTDVTSSRCPASYNGFIMDPVKAVKVDAPIKNMDADDAPPYAQVMFDDDGQMTSASGIWIENTTDSARDGFPAAYDFVIRACWYSPGQTVPSTTDTVVRLYES